VHHFNSSLMSQIASTLVARSASHCLTDSTEFTENTISNDK
jgi:hypothetical protein